MGVVHLHDGLHKASQVSDGGAACRHVVMQLRRRREAKSHNTLFEGMSPASLFGRATI